LLASVVGWVMIGFVAGVVAHVVHPGLDSMGYSGTILLGVSGALFGGGGAYLFDYGTSPAQVAGWLTSIVGAVVPLSFGGYLRRE
jgi:uncharacterized membrane protein YeaQ/YmgE (transglycosylase-associated protein family)